MAKEKVAVQVPEGQAPPVSSRRADLENWLAALLPGFRAVARQAVFFLVGLLCARGGGHALSLYVEYGFGMRNRLPFAVASIGACPLYRCDSCCCGHSLDDE